MSKILFKQPNGKYGCFNTEVHCVTSYNVTADEYIDIKMAEAFADAREDIKNAKSFNDIDSMFLPTDMSEYEYKQLKKLMSK